MAGVIRIPSPMVNHTIYMQMALRSIPLLTRMQAYAEDAVLQHLAGIFSLSLIEKEGT